MMNVNDQDFQSNAFYHQHDFQCCLAIMYLIVGSLSDSFMFLFHQSVLIIKNSLLTLLCNLCLFQVTSESDLTQESNCLQITLPQDHALTCSIICFENVTTYLHESHGTN